MHILLFTQLFYPVIYGGGEYIFYLIARELVKRGHIVEVITQRLSNTEKFEIFEGIRIHRVGSEFAYSGTLPPTIRHNLAYLLQAVYKGREIVKHSDVAVDIIHSNTYVPALSGQICSKLFRVPHIVTFHDVYQASNENFWRTWLAKQEKGSIPFYASTLSKIVEKIVMKLDVSVFHTVSETSKDDLIKFGVKKKIHVIPNGIDLSMYASELNSSNEYKDLFVVFVGRLVFYKNIEIVIRAFKKVIEKYPNARLIIIGDGPYRDVLIREAEIIDKNVMFTGRISQKEKIQYLLHASFVVFPSLVEGFGIAVIEGFASHKPVLVSNVKPLSDIVKDDQTGYVIAPFDVDTWASRMISLFDDNNKRLALGENAFEEFKLHYEINNVVSRIESLYYDLCRE